MKKGMKKYDLVLRQLELGDRQVHENFEKEFAEAGEKSIPENAFRGGLSFDDYLEKTEDFSKGKNLPDDWVPSTVYFLFRENEPKIIGAIDIRHELNDFLFNFAGHIGYGVVPSERRNGYASKMLEMALEICRDLGLEKVLITCKKENIGSAAVILKNGGVLENEVTAPSGTIVKRFWIKL